MIKSAIKAFMPGMIIMLVLASIAHWGDSKNNSDCIIKSRWYYFGGALVETGCKVIYYINEDVR